MVSSCAKAPRGVQKAARFCKLCGRSGWQGACQAEVCKTVDNHEGTVCVWTHLRLKVHRLCVCAAPLRMELLGSVGVL